MSEVTIIGVGLAKRVFQVHGAHNDGLVAFRNKLSRGQVLAFIAQQGARGDGKVRAIASSFWISSGL